MAVASLWVKKSVPKNTHHLYFGKIDPSTDLVPLGVFFLSHLAPPLPRGCPNEFAPQDIGSVGGSSWSLQAVSKDFWQRPYSLLVLFFARAGGYMIMFWFASNVSNDSVFEGFSFLDVLRFKKVIWFVYGLFQCLANWMPGMKWSQNRSAVWSGRQLHIMKPWQDDRTLANAFEAWTKQIEHV